MKELRKSVKYWRRCGQEFRVVFLTHGVYMPNRLCERQKTQLSAVFLRYFKRKLPAWHILHTYNFFFLLKTQYKSCTIIENILSTKWFDLTRSNTARLFCGVCDGQIAPASSRTAFPFSNLSVGLWTLSQQWCHHSLVSNFANYWPVFNFSPPDTHYMAWHRLLAMHVGLPAASSWKTFFSWHFRRSTHRLQNTAATY